MWMVRDYGHYYVFEESPPTRYIHCDMMTLYVGKGHFRKEDPAMDSSGSETTRPNWSNESCEGVREDAEISSRA